VTLGATTQEPSMFFLSKSVTDRIKSLGESDEVKKQIDAITSVPGYEVYANAVAEGVRDEFVAGAKPVAPKRHRRARPG
jgi:hypothetical protein